MWNIDLPFSVTVIITGCGTIGALFLADLTITEMRRQRNRLGLLQALIAVGLIYIGFMVPIWYAVYRAYGAFDFVQVIFLSTLPLWAYAVGGNRAVRVLLFTYIGLLTIVAVLNVIVTLP